jgi:hypothetical protein
VRRRPQPRPEQGDGEQQHQHALPHGKFKDSIDHENVG